MDWGEGVDYDSVTRRRVQNLLTHAENIVSEAPEHICVCVWCPIVLQNLRTWKHVEARHPYEGKRQAYKIGITYSYDQC